MVLLRINLVTYCLRTAFTQTSKESMWQGMYKMQFIVKLLPQLDLVRKLPSLRKDGLRKRPFNSSKQRSGGMIVGAYSLIFQQT